MKLTKYFLIYVYFSFLFPYRSIDIKYKTFIITIIVTLSNVSITASIVKISLQGKSRLFVCLFISDVINYLQTIIISTIVNSIFLSMTGI